MVNGVNELLRAMLLLGVADVISLYGVLLNDMPGVLDSDDDGVVPGMIW